MGSNCIIELCDSATSSLKFGYTQLTCSTSRQRNSVPSATCTKNFCTNFWQAATRAWQERASAKRCTCGKEGIALDYIFIQTKQCAHNTLTTYSLTYLYDVCR